ncbi:LytR/AlgR family response regulator transcription factor [Autumnicola musiva]|uniref:LytTR family DNA-binding domain-containing protein n=1 Tax=Autumnicola musiva TaxID=3075589 RepID=A0ABU3DA42_9FLAO|nr:LytTR family DNA-binding domain-containing protein [Zunongwangia sp. F117]MDT0678407.1 LytTR family DNA-binding domain-containing protein [Zunongwangia sp. F117]
MIYRTLIIEDEEPAKIRLTRLLSKYPEKINIIGFAINGEDGLTQIHNLQPDLIFLDIQMPGMTGFEMLSKLKKIPLVIFCTAYDEYALQAFETNSIDYLLKPVKQERLQKSLLKLDNFHPHFGKAEIFDFLQSIENSKPKKELTSITVKTDKKIIFLKLREIAYFKAKDKYISALMKNGQEHLAEQSLQNLESQLPDYFRRIHRSLLLNTDYIKEVHGYFNSRFAFILEDKERTKLISGRSYQKEIKEWLNA